MDYNNFIFNTDTLYEQLIGERTHSVNVSGTVPVYTAGIYASAWTDIGAQGATVRGWATLPIATYLPSISAGASYMLPFYAIYDNVNFYDLTCRIETSGTQYRCVVVIRNPFSSTLTAPTMTVSFLVQTFVTPTY